MNKKVIYYVFIIVFCSSISGCSKMFGKKNAQPMPGFPITAVVLASTDVNKNLSGDPSPIVVNIYQLKNSLAFNMNDFFSLYRQSKTTLSGDLLDSQQIIISPGTSKTMNLVLSPDARYIGVVVAYSDYQQSQWRALWPVNEKKKKNNLIINVNATMVSIRSAK